MEAEGRSLRNAPLSAKKREERGLSLMSFFRFAETLQHEYSHCCSFQSLMKKTGWEDPEITAYSQDYHLHDELIARYRGTMAFLKMAEPYMEPDLLLSIFNMYWDGENKAFREEQAAIKQSITRCREEVTAFIRQLMAVQGLTKKEAAEELEQELGHPLQYAGEADQNGIPKLSDVEIAEFLCVEGTETKAIPLIYAVRNRAATYEGSQVFGLVWAYYDFLTEITGPGQAADHFLPEALDLPAVLDIPYYEYVEDGSSDKSASGFLSIKSLNERIRALPDLFRKFEEQFVEE